MSGRPDAALAPPPPAPVLRTARMVCPPPGRDLWRALRDVLSARARHSPEGQRGSRLHISHPGDAASAIGRDRPDDGGIGRHDAHPGLGAQREGAGRLHRHTGRACLVRRIPEEHDLRPPASGRMTITALTGCGPMAWPVRNRSVTDRPPNLCPQISWTALWT